MTYERAKERRDALEAWLKQASDALKAFPSQPNGLTPADVKASESWRNAKRWYDQNHANLRAFNAVFVKQYAKEIQAERRARDAGLMAKTSGT